MKNLVIVVGGSVVEYSMVVRDVADVYSLVNILSCLEYKSNEWRNLDDFLNKSVSSRLDSDCNKGFLFRLAQRPLRFQTEIKKAERLFLFCLFLIFEYQILKQ